MDGVVNGRWMCELSNWTGKAYRIPRTYFKKCLDRDELRAPSIYFLFGEDTEQGKMVVYIGETEDALKRIGDHIQNSKKDYWTEVIVFTICLHNLGEERSETNVNRETYNSGSHEYHKTVACE